MNDVTLTYRLMDNNVTHYVTVDATMGVEEIRAAIKANCHSLGIPEQRGELIEGEGWFGYDIDGKQLGDLVAAAKLIKAHGHIAAYILADALGYGLGGVADVERWFADGYLGEYDSPVDYAYYVVDEGLLGEVSDTIKTFIDYSKLAEDLRINGDVEYINLGSKTHVFSLCY